ncbi:MAG: Ig-like domain repeat protein [Treponema sp.]|jgi:hypothetical protein|nr:Ig-like domain repeat protein [Treponema sp.]
MKTARILLMTVLLSACLRLAPLAAERFEIYNKMLIDQNVILSLENIESVYQNGDDWYYRGNSAVLKYTVVEYRTINQEAAYSFSLDMTVFSGSMGRDSFAVLTPPSGELAISGFAYINISAGYIANRRNTEYMIDNICLRPDTLPPVISLDRPDIVVSNSDVTLTASVSDSESGAAPGMTSYVINSGNPVTGTQARITSEGSHTVTFSAFDRVGRRTDKTARVLIDKTPPIIEGLSAPGSWTAPGYQFSGVRLQDPPSPAVSGLKRNSLRAVLQGNSPAGISLSYNAATGMLDPFTVPGLGSGTHTLTLLIEDTAGNTGQASVSFNVDGTAPQFSAAVNGVVKKQGQGRRIPLRIGDIQEAHSGLNSRAWKYRIDGGAWTSFSPAAAGTYLSAELDVGPLAGGIRRLDISGADNCGNASTVETSFTVDDTPPRITHHGAFGASIDGAAWTNQSALPVAAADSESGLASLNAEIKRRNLQGQWVPSADAALNAGQLSFTPGTADGIFQVHLTAEDHAGNSGALVLYARIDRTPPSLTLPSGVSGGAGVSAQAEDAASGIDAASWEWQDGSGVWRPGRTATLGEGRARPFRFRVKDQAGNSAERGGSITVDLTPPQAAASVPAIAAGNTLALRDINAQDALTGIASAWYQVDGGTRQTIDGWPRTAYTVPLESYSEGMHRITLGASDGAGHTGMSGEYAFIIDRSPPEVSGLVIRDVNAPEKVLGLLDFTASEEALVRAQGTDCYRDRGERLAGTVSVWYWDIQRDQNAPAVFSPERSSAQPEFTVSGLAHGGNYLYIAAQDAAGNRSAAVRQIVNRDAAIPGAPGVKSPTHREARRAEHAGFLSTAEFQFIAASGMLSGTDAYRWELETLEIVSGISGTAQPVAAGTIDALDETGTGRLSLPLADNGENEFYRLSVRCIGGNGAEGIPAAYQFRVDSAAPSEVRIGVFPQVDEERWYHQQEALAVWNQPADMTGVAEYRYWISAGESWTPPTEEELAGYDLSAWGVTRENELLIDVQSALGGASSGKLRIGVCAEDYAGNRKLGLASLQCDFRSPVFEPGAGSPPGANAPQGVFTPVVTDAAAAFGKAKRIVWGRLADGESGADAITLIVAGAGSSRTFTLPPGAEEYTVDRLEDDAFYTIFVQGFDRAGNRAEGYTACVTGNGITPPRFALPYREPIQGFELSGQRIVDSGSSACTFEGLVLEIPAAMAVFRIQSQHGQQPVREALRFLPLEALEISGGLPLRGRGPAGLYEVSADGFSITGTAFSFDREYGLALEGGAYTRPVLTGGIRDSRQAALGTVRLGRPPVIRFSSGPGQLGGPAGIATWDEALPAFSLRQVETVSLYAGQERFDGPGIALESGVIGSGITLRPGEGEGALRIAESRVSAESLDLRGVLVIAGDRPARLTMAGVEYRVKQAGVRGRYLDIYEAALLLPPGCEPQTVSLGNFSIAISSGMVTNGPDFYAASLVIQRPGGGTFAIDRLEFAPDGSLYASGGITSEVYGTMRAHKLLLTNAGADWERGAEIDGFSALVHGFPVSARNARFTSQGILIEQGWIELRGGRRELSGLGLAANALNQVYRDGTILDSYTVQSGYGDPLAVAGGGVTAEGVFGVMTVPLGRLLQAQSSGQSWEFTVRFEPDGTMRGRLPSAGGIAIGGHIFEAEGIEFLGNRIAIDRLKAPGIPGLSGQAVFEGFSFNAADLLTAGATAASHTLALDGWNIAYPTLRLSDAGIGGLGGLVLPETLGGGLLEFADSIIGSGGDFISGIADNLHNAEIHGLAARLENAALQAVSGVYTLVCENPLISLRDIGGPDLRFGETVFNALGSVLRGAPGTEGGGFVSANGCRVDSAGGFIGSEGVILAGKLGAQWWDAAESIPIPEGIRLLAGGLVTGAAANGTARFPFQGWNLDGAGIEFGLDGITLSSNQITYRGITIDLGEAFFDAQGRINAVFRQTQALELPLVNGMRALLQETSIGAQGLEAAVTIFFPEGFGANSLRFEKIRLLPDGSFETRAEADRFNFSLGGFDFAFENISLDGFGLYIRQAELTMPESLEHKRLYVRGVRLSANGISHEDDNIEPFMLWGMEFLLNAFSLQGGLLQFYGDIKLPAAMPGVLSGRRLAIRELSAAITGEIRAFDARLEGGFEVPFLDSWKLRSSSLRISHEQGRPRIRLSSAELFFPAGYIADAIAVEHLMFDPLAGAFDFESLTASMNIAMNCGGLEFTLSTIRIQQDLTVGFSGSARFPSSGVPGFIAGKTITVDALEIKRNGALGKVNASLDGIEGSLLPGLEGLLLKNGRLSLIKEADRALLVSVRGDIALTAAMPGPLAGTVLTIESFTIDPSVPAVTEFKASAFVPSMRLFENQFRNLSVGLGWDAVMQTGLLSLPGTMILPDSFPDFLAGRTAQISSFTIGLDGLIRSFGASYTSEAGQVFTLVDAVRVSDVQVSVALPNGLGGGQFSFDAAGTVILDPGHFPEGIGGLKTAVRMSFDTLSGLKTVSASLAVPDQLLFGSVKMSGVSLRVLKEERSPLTLSLAGNLALPSRFPGGLKDMTVHIRRFTMNANGEITDLDAEAGNIDTRIFSFAELRNGSLRLRTGARNELIAGVQGTIRLTAPGLPSQITSRTFTIDKLELSTRDGIKAFEAGVDGDLSFTILGGLRVKLNRFSLSESRLLLDAGVTLPANYLPGLAGAQIDLETFKLGWDGKIIEIRGGLGALDIAVAGFSGRIDGLYFEQDAGGQYRVSLRSCRIRFPQSFGSLGGQYAAIKNAYFNPANGVFMGDIEAPKLSAVIAGFTLDLLEPAIEFTKQRIAFAQVRLNAPDFMGAGAVSVKGLKIAPGGIELSGGGIKLPDFTLGVLLFTNVEIEFAINPGGSSMFAGRGSVFIPSAGNISAALSFVDRSSVYPLGLKQAEFSYTLAAGGIPLGNTGLYINGITGGLSYGPPSELPGKVQGLFGSQGPRIRLGVSVGDAFGGRFISMKPVTWIDINNAAWAFQGSAVVLGGSLNISAELTAALSKIGFYAGAQISLVFVKGGVDIYIFGKNGKPIFSGEGYVRLGMKKGAIVNKKVLFIPIVVPGSDIWLPSVNAEFGVFTNGKTGFKGFTEVPILGQVGVFAGPGVFSITNLSSYQIEKPAVKAPSLRKSIRAAPGGVNTGGVYTDGTQDFDGAEDAQYNVYIGEGGRNGLERIVFLLGYTEGDPQISVESPSGIEYFEGREHTETVFMENVLALIVHSEESGLWRAYVSNAPEESYALQVLGVSAIPEVRVNEPSALAERVSGSFMVQGTAGGLAESAEKTGLEAIIQVREPLAPGSASRTGGPAIQAGSARIGADGRFTAQIPVDDIPDGEYLVSVQVAREGESISPPEYAPGTIRVDRSGLPMNPPEGLRVAETDRGTVTLRWLNSSGARTSGYRVKIQNMDTEGEYCVSAGNITSFTLPGCGAGQRLSFAVAALDDKQRESPFAGPVTITVGAERPAYNRPRVSPAAISVRSVMGEFIEGKIPLAFDAYREDSGAAGYALVRSAEGAERLPGRLFFTGPVKIAGAQAEAQWRMGIAPDAAPGLYRVQAEAVNEANGALAAPFTLEITVEPPMPVITSVEPAEIDGTREQALTIYGSGFVPGTRVFWQGRELALTSEGPGAPPSMTALRVLIPAQTAAGTSPLMVQGLAVGLADSKAASYPLTITLPDWRLVLHNRIAETVAGGTVSYGLSVMGINGFTGSVPFTALETPAGFTVSLPAVSAGSAAAIRVRAAGDAAPGTYTTRITGGIAAGGEGKTFEIITIVGEQAPAPRLSSVYPSAGIAGTVARVYGYGLGAQGRLYLNDQPLEVSHWEDGEAVFTVPDTGKSGSLYALTAFGESNRLPFGVRERGFSLRPAESLLEMSAGETKRLEIALSGYADTVYLQAEAEPGAPLNAALETSEAAPNRIIGIRISAAGAAADGTWKLRVWGKSRGYESAAEITVRIGGAFALETAELPEGETGVSYYAALSSVNGAGQAEYRLISGGTPPGLSMDLQGVISGIPRQPGSRLLRFEARDSGGRSASRELPLVIREDAWAQADKDGGMSRAVSAELPANAETAWRYDGKSPVRAIIAAEEQVIMLTDEGITALHRTRGALNWTCKGGYQKAAYAGGKLYALTSAGVLEARDMTIGSRLSARGGIQSFSTNGTIILAESADAILALDAAGGTLMARYELQREGGRVLWQNGVPYWIGETGFAPLFGKGAAWDAGEAICAAAADSRGYALLTETALILLDREGRELGRAERRSQRTAGLALAKDAALVADHGMVCEYRREDLSLRWVKQSGEHRALALGKEKAVIAGPPGLRVLNRSTGADIWQDEKSYTALALHRGRIYAADRQGRVYAYSGSANDEGPQTRIHLNPAAPDGMNGWYITPPLVQIQSGDRESAVAELKAWYNGRELADPAESFVLEDGGHSVLAYGVDTHGLRGAAAQAVLKVDAAPPESEYQLSAEPRNGWFTGAVTLSLEAWDEESGLSRIWTSMGTYTEPVWFGGQGVHPFSWYALDRAGNRETRRNIEIRIDAEAPLTEAQAAYDRGMTELSLMGIDALSGVDLIEYSIDGGPAERYTEPLVFMREGKYRVRFRAIDRAGNAGAWADREVWVTPPEEEALIRSASINGKERQVMSPARNGAAFARSRDESAALFNLPSYALGGAYLLWEAEDLRADESARIRFQVNKDAAVYLFLPPGLDADPKWSFVEGNVRINRRYYPEGAAIYMRRFDAGAWVELPSLPAGMPPPLTAVQERGAVFGDIQLREAGSPDSVMPGEYERGSVLILEAQVSPWPYRRRLPLRKRWLVNTGDGWIPLDGNQYALPEEPDRSYLTIRLELYTPDGQVEHRAEKTVGIKGGRE